MDIARPERARQIRRRRILWGAAAVLVVAAGSLALARLEPAAPSVERGTLWIDTVRRGEMLREVRGQGTLVPEREQWISAASSGQVVQVVRRPGAVVTADSVILELANPELTQQAQEAQSQVITAEADLRVLEAQLAGQLLNSEAEAAGLAAQLAEALLQVEADQRLHAEKLIPDLTLKISKLRADELTHRQELETQRLLRLRESNEAQIAGRRSQLEQLRTLQRLRAQQLSGMAVKAGTAGILQELPLEVGQRVAPGTTLAKVAQPEPLKAVLRIPETQAKDVALGQPAEIDTRNGLVEGRVSRIDPAARQARSPWTWRWSGAAAGRPSRPLVDGTIEIERLGQRAPRGPAGLRPGQQHVGLFRLTPDGDEAERVQVELGRTSANTVEIVSRPRRRRRGHPVRHEPVRRGRPGAREVSHARTQERIDDLPPPRPLIRLEGIKKVFYTDEVETHALVRRAPRDRSAASTSPSPARRAAARPRCSRSSACSTRRPAASTCSTASRWRSSRRPSARGSATARSASSSRPST